jgi:hypothetical protein
MLTHKKREKAMKQVYLSEEDWNEIYYALDSKLLTSTVQTDGPWRRHLKEIMEKIGPDGEIATKSGVEAN